MKIDINISDNLVENEKKNPFQTYLAIDNMKIDINMCCQTTCWKMKRKMFLLKNRNDPRRTSLATIQKIEDDQTETVIRQFSDHE